MATNQSNFDILIKRRLYNSPLSGAAPAENTLKNGELAMNEFDQTLYYGLSTQAGAISAVPIAGEGYLKDFVQGEAANATLGEPLTANIAVGGINIADSFPATTTLKDLVERLLVNTYYPTLVNPSATISSSLPSVVETGTKGVTLTVTYSDGHVAGKSIGGVWQAGTNQSESYGGAASKYTIDGQNNGLNNVLVLNDEVILDGANQFTATVDYDAGTYQPVDSKGANYQSTKSAGTTNSASVTVTGKRYSYYQLSNTDINAATSADIKALGNAAFRDGAPLQVALQPGHKYLVFAYPAEDGDVTEVFNVSFNKNDLGDFDTTGTNPGKAWFVKSTVQVAGATGGENLKAYNVYKLTLVNPIPTGGNPLTYNIKY